ncbi:hypothetical protein, partial [Vibrio sp. V39_P1S14PM300]|uniref:hypothetical protein n=2 Tax=Vibrio TaxID=662 RepID=UPI001372F5A8
MDFAKKTTLKGAPAVVGSHPGGNIIQQVLVDAGVEGLNVGHVVVITDGIITQRWDGSPMITAVDDGAGNITMTQVALGIVTANQFEGDGSVSTLRTGTYLRDR